MKRNVVLLGIAVGVVALLTPTVVLGSDQGPRTFKPNLPRVQLKEIYDRSEILRFDRGPVQLPRPVGGSPVATIHKEPVNGPIAMAAKTPEIESVLSQPRGGGSIYSGKQQDDREVQRLIRRLN
jgi:hypothetical protein